VIDSSAPRTTSARRVNARDASGADVIGAGGTGDAGARWEQHYPFTWYARSSGARC
jgi:hypothetical protein